jgi:MOSC domain-containing protein YiiM
MERGLLYKMKSAQKKENTKGKILAVCSAPKKGMIKTNINEGILIEGKGLKGDAHFGFAHRQISIIAIEDIATMIEKMPSLKPGDFAENLTTENIKLSLLKLKDILSVGDALLEVSQIGKECHYDCEVFKQIGECIMPQKGIFTRVIKGGKVRVGDTIEIKNRRTETGS